MADPLLFHDYCVRSVRPEELIKIKDVDQGSIANIQTNGKQQESEENSFTKKFSKCEKCRRSRTKVLVPNALLSVAHGKNDGVTCDFCGDVMNQAQPRTLPDVFEGRRGSKGGDLKIGDLGHVRKKKKNYVYCGECGKVVLKESLTKHTRDVHELSNKRQCNICFKVLSGPFSLKEHINAVHRKQTKHRCPKCEKTFAHFSNMNRHIRLIHNKMVVTHKYVNCQLCNKVVQSTSLKKHMSAIHERRRDFKCDYCWKSFAQSFTLKEHVAAKHTLEHSYQCKLCNKTFAHKTNCGRHLKTVHKEEVKDKYESEMSMIRDCIKSKENPSNPNAIRTEQN